MELYLPPQAPGNGTAMSPMRSAPSPQISTEGVMAFGNPHLTAFSQPLPSPQPRDGESALFYRAATSDDMGLAIASCDIMTSPGKDFFGVHIWKVGKGGGGGNFYSWKWIHQLAHSI